MTNPGNFVLDGLAFSGNSYDGRTGLGLLFGGTRVYPFYMSFHRYFRRNIPVVVHVRNKLSLHFLAVAFLCPDNSSFASRPRPCFSFFDSCLFFPSLPIKVSLFSTSP